MSKRFKVAAKANRNKFEDRVSIDDAQTYEIDFTPWQEDNSTITAVTWISEKGNVGVSAQTLTDGVASALLNFSQSGKVLVSVLAETGTEKKKIWLDIYAKDYQNDPNDYGICS